jgi:hypothetical protein
MQYDVLAREGFGTPFAVEFLMDVYDHMTMQNMSAEFFNQPQVQELPRKRRNAAVVAERLMKGVEMPSEASQPIGELGLFCLKETVSYR